MTRYGQAAEACSHYHRAAPSQIAEIWALSLRVGLLMATYVVAGPNPNDGCKTYRLHPDEKLLRLFAEDVLLAPPEPTERNA
jgi:hypothetical protein